jgi:hypothetical protein
MSYRLNNSMRFLINNNVITLSILFLLFLNVEFSFATNPIKYVTNKATKESFPIASKESISPILERIEDFSAVLRVIGHLQNDILNVSGTIPVIFKNQIETSNYVIIIGTIDKSPIINQLISDGKIDGYELEGKCKNCANSIEIQ